MKITQEEQNKKNIKLLNDNIDFRSKDYINNYSETEIFTFTIQIGEAKDLLFGSKAEDKESIIFNLAQVDGITTEEFAKKVLEKAQNYKKLLVGILVDKRKMLKD
jgi:hypothetical protein